MAIIRLGDNSDYSITFSQSEKNGKWFWVVRDEKGVARLLPPMRGGMRGFSTEERARRDAKEVMTGLGAAYRDLDIL